MHAQRGDPEVVEHRRREAVRRLVHGRQQRPADRHHQQVGDDGHDRGVPRPEPGHEVLAQRGGERRDEHGEQQHHQVEAGALADRAAVRRPRRVARVLEERHQHDHREPDRGQDERRGAGPGGSDAAPRGRVHEGEDPADRHRVDQHADEQPDGALDAAAHQLLTAVAVHALLLERDAAVHAGLTEQVGEHERRDPGGEAREHPADEQRPDHRRTGQWHGNASRWRPSWTNSWIREPGTSDVAPWSRPTR